jgi:hypothetical protein
MGFLLLSKLEEKDIIIEKLKSNCIMVNLKDK